LLKSLLLRGLLALGVGLLLGTIFDEIAFRFEGYTTSRPPKTVVLTIPPGTSLQVASGSSVIPASMVIVVGDTLLVHNQDSITHTLGPLVIPPSSSAKMTLNQIGNLAFTCSFEPTKYFGLEVQEALTPGVRLEGVIIAGVPLGAVIGLYSLIVWPLKKNSPRSTETGPGFN
jgi:hypothetical protein